MSKNLEQLSIFLSLVLRHKPDAVGVKIDNQGWTNVSLLIAGCNANNHPITLEELQKIVATDEKGRYSFSATGDLIRCNQGHSLEHVKIKMESKRPPATLYHGTSDEVWEPISKQGLIPGRRTQVHLSTDRSTAESVGARKIRKKGKLLILHVNAAAMFADGHKFYQSDNGVWLIDAVPPTYITKAP